MFDSKKPVIRRVTARVCVIAALSAIPLVATDVLANAMPGNSATNSCPDQPNPGPDYWHQDQGWRNSYPGPPSIGGYPPPWDAPFDGDYRHGRPGLPPRLCTGSFGSC
ncbi:hypothetical protein GCM10027262_75680 [Nocardia tengchongensis]